MMQVQFLDSSVSCMDRLRPCGCLLGCLAASYTSDAGLQASLIKRAGTLALRRMSWRTDWRMPMALLLLSASFLAAATLDRQLSRASSVSGLTSTDAMYCG